MFGAQQPDTPQDAIKAFQRMKQKKVYYSFNVTTPLFAVQTMLFYVMIAQSKATITSN
jgi:hypothetical protein